MRLFLVTISWLFFHGVFIDTGNKGIVINVIDGNTLQVKTIDQQTQTYILAGIDCPELDQEFGAEAKEHLEKILLRKKVSIIPQGKDRLGNPLALVTLNDDEDPRIELLKEGLAWTTEKNPNVDLEAYRKWAQLKGKGLWQKPNPTPPWVFRRQQTLKQPKSS